MFSEIGLSTSESNHVIFYFPVAPAPCTEETEQLSLSNISDNWLVSLFEIVQ